MTRQPRATIGKGGYAPSMKGTDPRLRRSMQPTVAEDTVRARALQGLTELASTATAEEQVTVINEMLRILSGKETR